MSAIEFAELYRREKKKARENCRLHPPIHTAPSDAHVSGGSGAPPGGPWSAGAAGDRLGGRDLGTFQVAAGRLERVLYVPDFVDEAEEAGLVRGAEEAGGWEELAGRHLQNWGGIPTTSAGGMAAEPLPPFLVPLTEALVLCGAFPDPDHPPNHCLLNMYGARQGIAHHMDGPRYHPTAAILSLGSPATLEFRRPRGGGTGGAGAAGEVVASLVLRPRSLLVFDGRAYSEHTHGIEPRASDVVVGEDCVNLEEAGCRPGETIPRGARTSITIRHAVTSDREWPLTGEWKEELARRQREWFAGINEGGGGEGE